jgi:formylglycine-generating enzyme required for sulfatase activity
MVVVPRSAYLMGSPPDESGKDANETPQHRVTIAKPFAVGKVHVTVEQFDAFVTETGYDAGDKCWTTEADRSEERKGRSWRNPGYSQGGDHPAVCLNWNDAVAYVEWLGRKTGKPYRLLTEAEWEYAARAGSTTRYSFGNDAIEMCHYGNGADQTARSRSAAASGSTIVECRDGFATTAPAGSFAANEFGLQDMHGNAWQWTADCYHQNYDGAPADGAAWISGDCSRHVVRGGSWDISPRSLRSALRGRAASASREFDQGFRVGRTLSQ